MKRSSLLQARTVGEDTYQCISDALYVRNIDYSSGQLRVKMKSLRRQFSEAKNKGLHGGSNWRFYNQMALLFPDDSPQIIIEDDCAMGLVHFNSLQSSTKTSDQSTSRASLNQSTREASVNGLEDVLDLNVTVENNTAWLQEYLDNSGAKSAFHIPPGSQSGTATSNQSTSRASLNQSTREASVNGLEDVLHLNVTGENNTAWFEESSDNSGAICSNTASHMPLETYENHEETALNNSFDHLNFKCDENENFVDANVTDLVSNVEWTNALDMSHASTIELSPAEINNAMELSSSVNRSAVEQLRSPSRKKTNLDGTSPLSPVRLTPKKPARRKTTTQLDLMWSPESISLLLKECIRRKPKMQQEKVSDATWKDIAKAMKDANEDVSWQLCKDKYNSLCNFFHGSLLRVGGILAGTKCPYYDSLCELHDIPEEFAMPKAPSTIARNGNQIWTPEAVQLLISLYQSKKGHFDGTESHIRHSLLYAEVAEAMAHFDHNFSSHQVSNKWNELKERWNREYDSCHKTGSSPSTWQWYDAFEKIFGDSPGAEALFAFSSGTRAEYLVKGKNQPDTNRSTRTRPSTQPQSSKAASNKRATYKDCALLVQEKQVELQEKKVQNQDAYLEELRLMRQTMAQSTIFFQQILLQKQQQREEQQGKEQTNIK